MLKPKIFIFLHGYNSSGCDMKFIEKSFRKISHEESVFLYPDAPFKAEENGKMSWFPVLLGDDKNLIDEEIVFESMNQSMPYLTSYIDNIIKKYSNFSYEDIILIGFSQGAVFAIHTSLWNDKKIGGVISFSGGFVNPNNVISNKKINKVPILIVHGLEDKILPYYLSVKAEKDLKREDFDIESHYLSNTKHLITKEGLDIANNFIKRICNY